MRAFRVLSIGVLWLASSGAALAAPSGPMYRLQFSVARESKPVIAPAMLLGEGQVASLEVGPDQDGDALLLRVSATRVEHPRQKPGRWLQLAIELLERRGQGDWVPRASPWTMMELVADGAGDASPPATIAIEGGGPGLTLSVKAADASPAAVAEFLDQCAPVDTAQGGDPRASRQSPQSTPVLPAGDPTRCCVTCQGGQVICCYNSCCGVGSCGCCSPDMW